MALKVTSAIVSSPTSSLNCIIDIPKPPLSVHTRPSKSSISNLMNNLLPPPLSSYPPMSPSEINHQYIPTNPLYLPHYLPEWPLGWGEDISWTGAGTRYIRITARDPTREWVIITSIKIKGKMSRLSIPWVPSCSWHLNLFPIFSCFGTLDVLS